MSNFIMRWLQGRELQRKLAPLQRQRTEILGLDGMYANEDDAQLRNRIAILRDEATNIRAQGKSVELLVPKAFALVREAVKRVLGVTPYDTQVLAGLALYHGCIAEMGTGEGKTLTAPFAAFAHVVLHGRQVHICTANNYLAQRDASMLLPLYRFLGLNLAVSTVEQSKEMKRGVYQHDVIYSTHRTLANDYLTDNLARARHETVMARKLDVVIVDEADAALIDEARLPVVLAAGLPSDVTVYTRIATVASEFVRTENADGTGDFWVDVQDRVCALTDAGYEHAAKRFVELELMAADAEQYSNEHQALLMMLGSALAARHLLFVEQHYVVKNGTIVLIDEATGRLAENRRWDAGLQQALEAKEGLAISPDALPLARITLQHFFRQYAVLAGMTGTAMDDADELQQVYGVSVVAIPSNKPNNRIDEPERFYRTMAAKLAAVVEDVKQAHRRGQPVLIGTASVAQSAELSQLLSDAGLKHEVLNATNHSREAEIIAGAGAPGAITVSTNMAGRGVDILLGGNVQLDIFHQIKAVTPALWEALGSEQQEREVEVLKQAQAVRAGAVRAVGGLRVIGLERYESRRQDRQLRGRCGRQGDPGQTVFYLSLEDTLVENYAGEKIRSILAMLDVKPGDEFEFNLVKKAIDSAQREVEGKGQESRKQLMEFEGVLDSQRHVIYSMRDQLLYGDSLEPLLSKLTAEEAARLVGEHLTDPDFPETWNFKGFRKDLSDRGLDLGLSDKQLADMDTDDIEALLRTQMESRRLLRLEQVGEELREAAQRVIALQALDRLWIQHLDALDQLRRGIHLRSHAKTDPRQVFAREGFEMFKELTEDIKRTIVKASLTWQSEREADTEPAEQPAEA